MDEDLKKYADTVCESIRMESGKTVRDARANFLAKRLAPGGYPSLSGVDIEAILRIFDDHIERCMMARFVSYEEAYVHTGRTPSEQDLDDILIDCQAVRLQELKHSMDGLSSFISSHGGGVPYLPTEAMLEQGSAHGHDRVLQKWKIWKAKTQLKPAPAKVQEREKQRDVLVPTYNKAEFALDLAALTAKSTEVSPVSLLFMDLDKFKSINDGPGGHEAGNRALQAFAESLLGVCDGKGIVYRWGGDEFCVLLPNHSIEEAAAVAERIRHAVRAIRTDKLQDGLSTSVGVACFPGSTADPSTLVSQADQAMYASKEAGGQPREQSLDIRRASLE
jgi:diguanylate cyclase (GGDEF)-like protein